MNELAFLFLQFCLLKVLFFFFTFFPSLFSISEKILNFACFPDLDYSPTVTEIYMRIFPGVCY